MFAIGLSLSLCQASAREIRDVWSPAPGTSWQWQLQGPLDESLDVAMYDLDLFDTPDTSIARLQARGVIVICYFSAGSLEEWREDIGTVDAALIGLGNGWPGEYWLDIRQPQKLAGLMLGRLDLAVAKGCDGVEPDNVDAFENHSGFDITAEQQASYNRWLADQAHQRGLSIGLKNDLQQIAELEPWFDWALNESCFEYDECHLLLPFIRAGKAVFGVDYRADGHRVCEQANALDFDWLLKPVSLNAIRLPCR